MTKPRLALVTAGHLSTCPRMLKAADALADEGYEVHVVSTRSTAWATEADRGLEARRRGRWRSTVVDYSRGGRYWWSGARSRVARAIANRVPAIPFALASRAFGRVHPELVEAARATSADFFYGGTTGGIGATFEAARQARRPYALDLEDFFSGEPREGSLEERLAERIEREIFPGARFLTASSEAISAAYVSRYGVVPETIHNTFPLPGTAPQLARRDGPLRLYWFSQTIGPGRGIEEAVVAAGEAGVEVELHLRGSLSGSYRGELAALAKAKAPRLALVIEPPAPPDEMTSLASAYDVGLSLEQAVSVNRVLCLTNKALVYLVAGLALAMTDTAGHRPLREELRESALVVPTGDVRALADGLRRLSADRSHLLECRRAAWAAATSRWHWEHPEERGKLLRVFAEKT